MAADPASDLSKTATSQQAKGAQSYYYWHGDADRRRQIGDEQPVPKPEPLKLKDGRMMIVATPHNPSDPSEAWVDPPEPGGYVIAQPAHAFTAAELFNWSKYVSPPRGWPERHALASDTKFAS